MISRLPIQTNDGKLITSRKLPNQQSQPFQGIVLPSQKAFNTQQGPLNLDQIYFGALGPPPVQQKPIHFRSLGGEGSTELDKAYLEALKKPQPKSVWEMLFDRKKNTKQDAVDRLNKLLYRLGSGHKMTIDSLHSNRMLIAVLDVSTEFLTPKELIHTAEFVIQSMAAKDRPALPTVLMEHGLSHSSHEIRSFAANYLMLALPFTPETMKAFRSRLGVEENPEVITLLKRGISSHTTAKDLVVLQADLHMDNPAFRSLGIEGLSQFFNPGVLGDLLSALDRETDPQLMDQIGKVLKEKAKEDIKLSEPMVIALETVALAPHQYQSPGLLVQSILNALLVSKKIEGFPRFFQLFKSSDLIHNDAKLGELLEKLMKRSFNVENSPLLLSLLKGPNNTEKNQKLALTLLDGTAHEALTQPLFEYLENPDSKFPKLALTALAHHGKKMERNHLEKLLSSVNPDLRLLAAKGFVHQAEDKDIEMLFHRLNVETQPEIQSELTQALILVGDTPKSQKFFEAALSQPDAIERVQTTALQGLEGYGFPALKPLLEFARKVSKNNSAEGLSENLFNTLELTILNVLEGAYYWPSSGRKPIPSSQKGKDAGGSHDNTLILEAMEKCIENWDGLAAESMDSYTSEDLFKGLLSVLDTSVNALEMKSVEEKVLTLLKRTHGLQLVDPLIQYLENPRGHFPKLAADTLAKSWDEGHRRLMFEKVASPQAVLQLVAAKGISEFAKESDIPELIKILASNRNAEVQKILGDTLKPLASSKSVFSLLSDVLTGNASLREKVFAAQYMSHHGSKALEPLFKALDVRELSSSTATPSAEALELMKMVETSVTAIVGKDKESLPILYERSLSKNNAAVRVSAMALAHQADQWAKLKSDKKSLVYDAHEAEMATLRLYAQHANPILKEAGQKALKIHVDEKAKKLESLGIRGSYEKESNFEMLEDLSENGLDPEVRQAALEAYNKLVERSERPRTRRRRY